MQDWVIRPAVAEDEDCIAPMWLRQLARSQDARAHGAKDAREPGSDAQISFWEVHQPIVTALIRGANVVVACDPERSTYEPGRPAVVWGWAVTSGDVVYGVGIKHRVSGAGLGCDLARDLLGGTLSRPMRYVLDLGDLARLHLIPSVWTREKQWASSLRQLSTKVLAGDLMYQAVAGYVADPHRERWLPSSKRAA